MTMTLEQVRDWHREMQRHAPKHKEAADAIDAEIQRQAKPARSDVPDDQIAYFVERAAEIISGAPFPSGRSMFKARQISDLAMSMLVAQPDVARDAERLDFIAAYNWVGVKTRCVRGIEDSNPASLRKAIDAAMTEQRGGAE